MTEPDNPYQSPPNSPLEDEGSKDWKALVKIALAVSCTLAGFMAFIGVVGGIDAMLVYKIDFGRLVGDTRGRTMLFAQCGLAVACVLFVDAARSWLRSQWRRATVGSVLHSAWLTRSFGVLFQSS